MSSKTALILTNQRPASSLVRWELQYLTEAFVYNLALGGVGDRAVNRATSAACENVPGFRVRIHFLVWETEISVLRERLDPNPATFIKPLNEEV